jgi:hypothetical protein
MSNAAFINVRSKFIISKVFINIVVVESLFQLSLTFVSRAKSSTWNSSGASNVAPL